MCYEYMVQYNCVVVLAHNIIISQCCGGVSTKRNRRLYFFRGCEGDEIIFCLLFLILGVTYCTQRIRKSCFSTADPPEAKSTKLCVVVRGCCLDQTSATITVCTTLQYVIKCRLGVQIQVSSSQVLVRVWFSCRSQNDSQAVINDKS